MTCLTSSRDFMVGKPDNYFVNNDCKHETYTDFFKDIISDAKQFKIFK